MEELMSQNNPKSPEILEEDDRLLADHQAYLTIDRRIQNVNQLRVGDIAQFMYDAAPRTVFVLNPKYGYQLHGLSLKKLTHHALITEVIGKMHTQDTPQSFYNRIIKHSSVVEKNDAYRTYDIRKIQDIRVRHYKTND
jgi:hypothetical protein